MTDKDGRKVKCVKPILIKKEIEIDYATTETFERDPNEDIFLFTDEERVPFADPPYESKSEEETDDESTPWRYPIPNPEKGTDHHQRRNSIKS